MYTKNKIENSKDILPIGTIVTDKWKSENELGVVLEVHRGVGSLAYLVLFANGIEDVGWTRIYVYDECNKK